jgi:hypothetical protein
VAHDPKSFSAVAAALLVLALLAHFHWLWPYVHRADNDFDAVHLYLPLARQLTDMGPRFFLTEASIQAPPVSYV